MNQMENLFVVRVAFCFCLGRGAGFGLLLGRVFVGALLVGGMIDENSWDYGPAHWTAISVAFVCTSKYLFVGSLGPLSSALFNDGTLFRDFHERNKEIVSGRRAVSVRLSR